MGNIPRSRDVGSEGICALILTNTARLLSAPATVYTSRAVRTETNNKTFTRWPNFYILFISQRVCWENKIMASGLIISLQIDGETMETVSDFILGGSKITADGDCSHEIKRHLLLGSKVMTNLDSILKSRDITLSTQVHIVKPIGFLPVMYRCESWTIKKAEC